mmetsp:Transcript_6040/g.22848  ORF Transcript_6040/g.22848 Transcript_6040/m.22848 type:complete len:89 (+) Transcript_6040:62-328(+)
MNVSVCVFASCQNATCNGGTQLDECVFLYMKLFFLSGLDVHMACECASSFALSSSRSVHALRFSSSMFRNHELYTNPTVVLNESYIAH